MPDMENHTRWYVGGMISAVLAIVTSPTIIGAFVFGLISLGCIVKGYEAKHGDRPWWSKSFITLWKERKEA